MLSYSTYTPGFTDQSPGPNEAHDLSPSFLSAVWKPFKEVGHWFSKHVSSPPQTTKQFSPACPFTQVAQKGGEVVVVVVVVGGLVGPGGAVVVVVKLACVSLGWPSWTCEAAVPLQHQHGSPQPMPAFVASGVPVLLPSPFHLKTMLSL